MNLHSAENYIAVSGNEDWSFSDLPTGSMFSIREGGTAKVYEKINDTEAALVATKRGPYAPWKEIDWYVPEDAVETINPSVTLTDDIADYLD